MTATTHPEFNDKTEGLEVAQAFAEKIRGRTIVITGVNRNGIGYAAAESFVSALCRTGLVSVQCSSDV